MKRQYFTPSFVVVQIDPGDVICMSYGTIPVGGRTDSFDDPSSGTISTGGWADELDAPAARGSWEQYEQ
ncbi:MAG: hypothetical protein K6E86_09450 [Bacteroidales bacterium]|nr:hypothetical protein [Bacteroidales bacterium]